MFAGEALRVEAWIVEQKFEEGVEFSFCEYPAWIVEQTLTQYIINSIETSNKELEKMYRII